MSFKDCPQYIRDLIFSFWSPTKQLKQRVAQARDVCEAVEYMFGQCGYDSDDFTNGFINNHLKTLRKGFTPAVLKQEINIWIEESFELVEDDSTVHYWLIGAF